LDKYEYKLRLEEIKTLNRKGRFQEAAQVADTIDWKKVRNVSTLGIISDVYKINRRFEDAKEILLLANEKSPQNRRILYAICDLTIKMGQVVEAVEYYKEFVQLAPNDNSKYILLYKIYEAQDISLEERISVLKEYKKREYNEKWAYELAFLYHRVGLATECVEECDQLILWFGEGKYVTKAMELKMLYMPLSPAQQQAYDRLFGRREAVREEKETVKAERQSLPAQPQKQEETEREEELDIQVKPMDMGQYNTMNLQAALAESMKEVLETEETQPDMGVQAMSEEPVAQQWQAEEPVVQQPVYGGDDAEYQEDVSKFMKASADWDAQATGQLETEEGLRQQEEIQRQAAERETAQQRQRVAEQEAALQRQRVAEQEAALQRQRMAEQQAEMLRQQAAVRKMQEPTEQEARMEHFLAQEYDGQISLALPEEKNIEKQITGQMNIDDVLAEWEKLKKANEEKRKQETKRWMLQQTGSLFEDFDQLSRDGVLEKLQREEALPVEDIQRSRPEDPAATSEVEELEEIAETQDIENTAYVQPTPANAAARTVMAAQGVLDNETAQPKSAAGAGETVRTDALQNAGNGQDAEQLTEEQRKQLAVEEQMRAAQAQLKAAQEQILEAQRKMEALQAGQEEQPEGKQPQDAVQEISQQQTAEQGSESEQEAAPENPAESGSTDEAEVLANQPETDENGPKQETAQSRIQDAQSTEESGEPESAERTEDEAVGARTQQLDAQARSMTDEEKELFAPFVPTKGAMRQLVKALDSLSLSAYTGNMIITGAPGSDMMKLAKNIIREVRASDQNFSGKIARISGNVLNTKDAYGIIAKIPNGALIIEGGGKLSDEGAANLLKALNQETTGIIVFLLDTKRSIGRLMERSPKLAAAFTARFDIAALDSATLVKYGCQYAYNMEFSIDELGRLALHTRIEDMQTSDHAVTIEEVREIVDEAIEHAERKSLRHFLDVLFRKRYDEDDMIILRERDFI